MNNLKRTKIFSKRKKIYQKIFGIRARAMYSQRPQNMNELMEYRVKVARKLSREALSNLDTLRGIFRKASSHGLRISEKSYSLYKETVKRYEQLNHIGLVKDYKTNALKNNRHIISRTFGQKSITITNFKDLKHNKESNFGNTTDDPKPVNMRLLSRLARTDMAKKRKKRRKQKRRR